MTDAVKCHQGRGIWTVNASYMEQVETELNTALAQRDEARRLLEMLEDAMDAIKSGWALTEEGKHETLTRTGMKRMAERLHTQITNHLKPA